MVFAFVDSTTIYLNLLINPLFSQPAKGQPRVKKTAVSVNVVAAQNLDINVVHADDDPQFNDLADKIAKVHVVQPDGEVMDVNPDHAEPGQAFEGSIQEVISGLPIEVVQAPSGLPIEVVQAPSILPIEVVHAPSALPIEVVQASSSALSLHESEPVRPPDHNNIAQHVNHPEQINRHVVLSFTYLLTQHSH
jgi:hypothetical protein